MEMAPMSFVAHSSNMKDKDVNLRLLRNGVLIKRLDVLLNHNRSSWAHRKPLKEEIRSLEFWRSVIAECLASFFYVFLICSCYALESDKVSSYHIALASGSTMATLILCFGPISGAHVNPVVTVALTITRKITVLRLIFYLTAQCGGAIAGTALLYGMTLPADSGKLGNPAMYLKLGSWQGFAVEALLSFIIVMTVFATLDPYQSPVFSYPSPLIGVAYLTCSLTAASSTGAALNPARALGPAFVMNRWTNHWVYWGGPLIGAILAGLTYEYVLDSRKNLMGLRYGVEDLNQDSSLPSNDEECEPNEPTNQLSSPPQYPPQNNVYHSQPRYDDYGTARQRSGYMPPQAHSNYAQFPPLPPPPQPHMNDYRAVQNAAYGESTSGNSDSIYDTAAFRPLSSASRNYSSIYGSRSGVKPPQRLDCGGPGSTKF
ncbi:hypothetical protein CHUAL_001446 [Chamberlinius hualienensis]